MSLPVDFSRIDVVGRIREEMAAESDDDEFTVAKKQDREIPSMVCCAAAGKSCANQNVFVESYFCERGMGCEILKGMGR